MQKLASVKSLTVAGSRDADQWRYPSGLPHAVLERCPMSDTPTCDAELDASGLNCPLPLLKAKMELNRLASGAVLKVLATDAGSQRDFRTFAQLAGHTLLHETAEAGVYTYWLRKA
jgi:TusA-related sulfurtransferase